MTFRINRWQAAPSNSGGGLLFLQPEDAGIPIDPLDILQLNIQGQTYPAYVFRHTPAQLVVWLAMQDFTQLEKTETLEIAIVQRLAMPQEQELLILAGRDEALGPLLYLARQLNKQRPLVVLMEWSHDQPFRPVPSRIMLPGAPAHALAAIPLLEDQGVASRICAPMGMPGCFEGTVETFLHLWPVAERAEKLTLGW